METKYTPGPWFAVDYAGSICIQNGPMYEDVDLLSYDCICGDTPVRYKDEVEANAKLMAAAPDLLESLNELLDINKSNESFDIKVDRMVIAMNKAKEAIKKATE